MQGVSVASSSTLTTAPCSRRGLPPQASGRESWKLDDEAAREVCIIRMFFASDFYVISAEYSNVYFWIACSSKSGLREHEVRC